MNYLGAVWLSPCALSKTELTLSPDALSSAVFATEVQKAHSRELDLRSRMQSGFQELDCQQTEKVTLWF